MFDTIDRTLASFAVAIIGAEWIVRILPRGTHDWRMFIKPDELEEGLRRAGFVDFLHKAFDPSFKALAELTLFKMGLLEAERMSGGFTVSEPSSLFSVSYIGAARKKVLNGPVETLASDEVCAVKGSVEGEGGCVERERKSP